MSYHVAGETAHYTISFEIVPILEGREKWGGTMPLDNFAVLTDNSLVPSEPDVFHGALPAQLNKQVRKALGPYIIPSALTSHNDPTLAPNFFVAAEGHGGSIDIARRRATYSGALGARGLRELQLYGGKEGVDAENKAYTLTLTYWDAHLTVYVSHILPSAGAGVSKLPRYAMTEIKSYDLGAGVDEFAAGVAAYRNARDWAKWQIDVAIRAANEKCARDKSNTPDSGHDAAATQDRRSRVRFAAINEVISPRRALRPVSYKSKPPRYR